MKPKSALRSFLLLAGSSLLAASSAHALSGAWTANSDGNWTDTTKWQSGTVASGTDYNAAFNDVITADRIINLNTAITIGGVSAVDASHNYTISGGNILTLDTTTGTAPAINVGNANRTLTISSEIAGTDGLRKTGNASGTLLLSGSNTYTGGTTLVGGILSIGHANALGGDSSGTIALGAGTSFRSSNDTARTFGNLVTIAGSNASPTNFTGTGNLTFTNTASSALGATTAMISVASGIKVSLAQAFSGSAFQKSGTGTLALTGESTYTGITTITPDGGVLEVTTIRNVGAASSSLGAPTTAANGVINIRGGATLRYVGAGNETDRQIANASNASVGIMTIEQAGTGLLKFTAGTFIQALQTGAHTLKLQGSNTGTGEISGAIAGVGSNTVSVTKDGTGTWIFSGSNNYTNTTVSNGTLLATKAAALPGYSVGSTRVNVASGATLAVRAGATLGVVNGWAASDITTLLGTNSFASGSKLGIDVNSLDTFTYSSDIGSTQATKGLVKSGAGKLVLDTATHTYTGNTEVNAGTLIVNGNISTSTLTTVASAATLGGTGTVGAAQIQSGGILAPGDGGIATLSTGALTLDSGSFSNFEINAATDTADLAISSALLTFGGTLNVTNIGGTFADGDIFNLFDWITTTGTFSAVNLPALTGGLIWDTDNLYTNGTIVVAVPEPRAALLGGLGMLMLLRRRRA